MSEPIPPHALALVDQWKAELRQRLDVAINDLRESFAHTPVPEADLCGPVHTYALMTSFEKSSGDREAMACLLAEAVSRLINAKAVDVGIGEVEQ